MSESGYKRKIFKEILEKYRLIKVKLLVKHKFYIDSCNQFYFDSFDKLILIIKKEREKEFNSFFQKSKGTWKFDSKNVKLTLLKIKSDHEAIFFEGTIENEELDKLSAEIDLIFD